MPRNLFVLAILMSACTADDFSSTADLELTPQGNAGNSTEFDFNYSTSSPALAAVYRIYQDSMHDDGFIDDEEAFAMVAFTKKYGSRNEDVASFLGRLAEGSDPKTQEAEELLASGDRLFDSTDVPLKNDVYELRLGNQDFLIDDELLLRFDGIVEGDTKIISHSRGYAAKKDGVLFKRHGSLAPHYSSTNTASDTEKLRETDPAASLDKAAEIFGLQLDEWTTFSYMARDPNYYDPSENTPYWAGICQGWTHNALDDRLNVLVDVEGPAGERGLWIFGQWISRADLGNAMMGASYSLGIADSITIDSFVTPESLVKALGQHVMRSGSGLRVDIWNDEHNQSGSYSAEIWNQPLLEASIEVDSVSDQTKSDILTFARNNASMWSGAQDYVSVRRVQATARWGTEANDSWEEAPLFKNSEWNMYLVTDFSGRVVEGFMANELAAEGIESLPIDTSDGLPDYIAIPKHELTDAALDGGEHYLLNPDNSEGKRFAFLVGTVLARGIPNPTRKLFEAEFFEGYTSAEDLAYFYPGIANAYSPEQWERVFESRLGAGQKFGAVWGLAESD